VYCLKTRCGYVSIKLGVVAAPTTYTTSGEDITVTYTITNCGNSVLCLPIQIVDSKLGTTILNNVIIQPGQSQSFDRVYTTVTSDLNLQSIDFCATAFACIGRTSWLVSCPSSVTVTRNLIP
jgi:hypothetical protein